MERAAKRERNGGRLSEAPKAPSAKDDRNGASGGVRAEWRSLSEAPKVPSAKDGAEDWNRTSDTSIFSAVLYQLSYLGTAARRLAESS